MNSATTRGIAFGGYLASGLIGPGGLRWTEAAPEVVFANVEAHFPKYVWNFAPYVRKTYLETIIALGETAPVQSRNLSTSSALLRDKLCAQALVDLKVAVCGPKLSRLEFDPLSHGDFRQDYAAGTRFLSGAIDAIWSGSTSQVFCENCSLVIWGFDLDSSDFVSPGGCVDCHGKRVTYSDALLPLLRPAQQR